MIVLGWLIDTRQLLLRLPEDKLKRWGNELRDLISNPIIFRAALESLIGKLVHAANVVLLSLHFLSRLQDCLTFMKAKNIKRPLQLLKEEIEDAVLWEELLVQAHQGISMNGLVLRNPTCIGFSDSYPLRLGGFTHGGRGLRLKLNPALVALGEDISNNVLEFLGMAITLWLSLLKYEGLGLENELLLILGNNTSAISWIIRSSLPKSSVYRPAVLFIARKIASIISKSQNFIVPRYIPGQLNSIVDWLSFKGEERLKH